MTEVVDRIGLPTRTDVDRLCEAEGAGCISIYMPVGTGFGDVAQNAIRLKNLARSADQRLESLGVGADGRRSLLAPINDELLAGRSPRFPAGGLAAFLGPSGASWFHLRDAPDELLHIGERFHVRPVLDAVADDRMCVVLTLDLDGVRLFECTPLGTRTIDMPDIPASLEESTKFDVVEPHRQYHSGSAKRTGGQGISVLVHGQGGGADQARVKKQIMEYLRQVAAGVASALAEAKDPLVLVGPPHLVGLFRDANRYPHLFDEAVLSDPKGLEPRVVCDKVLDVLEPEQEKRRQQLLDQFGTLRSSNPERAPLELDAVLTAAANGRVDTLIVARGIRAWGRYGNGEEPVVHSGRKDGDEDLVDRAAWYTVRNGGSYRPVEADRVPGDGPVAAILRY